MTERRWARAWVAREPGGLDVLTMRESKVPPPRAGEVTIEVRAAGVNPADAKHVARGSFTGPRPIGYEVAGVVSAVGPDTRIATGEVQVGDPVVAFRVLGGYADALTVPARDALAMPPSLPWAVAANLLLAGTTAAEMLHRVPVAAGATVVLHGASGAVGVSLLQQARRDGVAVVGTASPERFDVVRRYGGTPVAHGDGLLERLRDLAPPGGYAAALDAVGTDEAVEASLALVPREAVLTIAAQHRAEADGIRALAGGDPDSTTYRDAMRATLLGLAASRDLEVPVARTFPLTEAVEALRLVMGGHPGGKVALLP